MAQQMRTTYRGDQPLASPKATDRAEKPAKLEYRVESGRASPRPDIPRAMGRGMRRN